MTRIPAALALVCLTGLLAAACGAPAERAAPELRTDRRPNVVLIFVDDLGYGDAGFTGGSEARTPNLDRLAAEGVVFANGYVTHPFCGPSRAGLLTGRYPARFGNDQNFAFAPDDPEHGLPAGETTFASRLQRAGYRTGLVGKWQLGAAEPFHPRNRGFDSFYGFLGGGHDYYESGGGADGDPYLLPLEENGEEVEFDGYLTDALTARATAFIRERDDAPFFLYLAYNAPHEPLQAPAALIREYRHVEDEERRAYLAMVESLDENVGRVLAALEETGARDDTIVFFLSDNGGVAPLLGGRDWADNGALRHGKTSLYEGGLRVPFVASWTARWPRGLRYDAPVISLDVAATALARAGVAPDPDHPPDGVDLDPFLRGEAAGEPHGALFWRQWSADADGYAWAVRAGRWKLVRDAASGEGGLYDLRADPGETRDLSAAEPETVVRLVRRWNDWNWENAADRYPADGWYQRITPAERERLMERRRLLGPFQIDPHAGAPPRSCDNEVAANPRRNPGLVEDCRGLMEARAVMGGVVVLDWAFDRPLREWEGVTLAGSPPRVAALRLRGRGLEGTVPAALGLLTELRVLDLGGNRLQGAVPPELSRLPNLRELRLDGNRLRGPLPPELEALAALETLRLGGNALEGCLPPALAALADGEADAPPACVVAPPSPCEDGVTVPDPALNAGLVADCDILLAARDVLTGGADLLAWEAGIDMRRWEGVVITGAPARVSGLRLGALRLAGVIPPQLGGLTALRILYLDWNHQLGGPIPPELGGLTALRDLRLAGNLLTGAVPPELAELPDLEVLLLAGNPLEGCLPSALFTLPEHDLDWFELPACAP